LRHFEGRRLTPWEFAFSFFHTFQDLQDEEKRHFYEMRHNQIMLLLAQHDPKQFQRRIMDDPFAAEEAPVADKQREDDQNFVMRDKILGLRNIEPPADVIREYMRETGMLRGNNSPVAGRVTSEREALRAVMQASHDEYLEQKAPPAAREQPTAPPTPPVMAPTAGAVPEVPEGRRVPSRDEWAKLAGLERVKE
jgi:hypothetical protein